MKQAVISILTPEDAKHAQAAVDEMRRVRCKAMLVFINPSSVMDVEDFTREADKRIQELEDAKQAASAREDYEGAANFRTQIQEAKQNRVNLISQGIKNVPQDKLVAAVNATADKFITTGAYVHQHTPPKDVLQADFDGYIISILPKYKFLKEGAYTKICPQTCETDEEFNAQAPNSTPTQPATASQPASNIGTALKNAQAPTDPKEARRTELKKYMKMRSVARGYGIQVEGRKTAEVISEILDREFPVAA